MALFDFLDFTREGPGVYPERENKKPLARFFAILFRKFWYFVRLNLMELLFSLPLLLLLWWCSPYLLQFLQGVGSAEATIAALQKTGLDLGTAQTLFALQQFMSRLFLSAFLFSSGLICLGPVRVGMSYLYRNYAREEHAFVWHDFKKHLLSNWKMATLHSALSLLFTLAVFLGLFVYGDWLRGSMMGAILKWFLWISLFLFSMMQTYIYQMMVTFDLPLRTLYRNAFLLVMANLPMQLLLFAIGQAIVILPPFLVAFFRVEYFMVPTALYYLFFPLAWTSFLSHFYVNLQIHKHMLSKITNNENL